MAIKSLGKKFNDKTALILGAGGVVPSLIVALQNLGVKKIFISNRTPKKIENIKLNFPFVEKVEWGEIKDCDVFINATSVGLKKGDEPVSYTHLRAHETDSYLVCRLLLEKNFFNDTATTEIYT